MKAFFPFALTALALVRPAFAMQLDFKTADDKLPRCCRAVDGVGISLFTEDRNWNKCMRVEVSKEYKDSAKGTTSWTGSALVGGTPKQSGEEVESGKSYDVSFDLRGNGVKVGLSVWVWTGDDFYKDRQVISLVKPNPKST
ncbi:MAG: hypothetical protein IJI35_10495, partial [Kiritimatiellae bacterium]|nr:hypothetical protein [Kiritimatiellia bacterium]